MRFQRLVIACLALSVGCKTNSGNQDAGGGGGGGGGGGVPPMPILKSSLDLSHVVGFAISGAGDGAARLSGGVRDWALDDGGVGGSSSTLYAIDDQGDLTATRVTTAPPTVIDSDAGVTVIDGGTTTSTTTEMPAALFDTPKYVIIGYNNLQIALGDAGAQQCSVILRKSDGALFCLPATSNLNGAKVESDGGDQLFITDIDYVNGGPSGAIWHVDMSSAQPTLTNVVAGSAADFTISSDSDALVSLDGTVATSQGLRVYKPNGGLQNLLASPAFGQWLAPSGTDFYFVQFMSGTGLIVNLATRQSDGSFVVSQQGSFAQMYTGGFKIVLTTATDAYAITQAAAGGATSNSIFDLLGPNAGTLHPVTALNNIIDGRGNGSSIFVQGTDAMGNGGIVRVDVPSFTQTTILAPGAFTLSAISLSSTGELTFAGLRNSDGAHVVGNVAAGANTYTILSATAPALSVLQRIN